MSRRRISSAHLTITASTAGAAIGCSILSLGLLAGCFTVDSGEDEFDPGFTLDNSGGSGGFSGSAGSAGSGGFSGASGSSGSGGASGSSGSSGSAGSGGSGGSGGSATNTALNVELYQGNHTSEACDTGQPTREQCLDTCASSYDACINADPPPPDPSSCMAAYTSCQASCPAESGPQPECIYANVYFLVTCNGSNVHELTANDVQVVIGSRDVGVEGSVLLTQQNGLQVDLLLDRSYSISQANSGGNVRDAARTFLDAMPDEARVRVSAFASEPQVPQVLGPNGSSYYYTVGTERAALSNLIDTAYSPYSSASSAAFTKLFDAAVGLASSAHQTDVSLAALPSVGVIFTDGADTASSFETAESARSAITSANAGIKIYAIGLGNEIDQDALSTLSEGRNYAASDKSTLVQVFSEVASELGAIYRYRVLVPSAATHAPGKLTVNYCGETSVIDFTMDSIGSGTTPSQTGVNSCPWAYDGVCDEPYVCDTGTDSADCP